MDIRQLRYFLEIVTQGSITRAAEVLGVAQPALSHHLKNMEQDLGTKLVFRSRTGVTPTESGTLLARRARAILDDLARTEDELRTLDADPAGVVRIGLPGTISAIVALPLLKAARDRYPRITLTVAEAMSGFIADWLAEGRVDMAVLYNPAQDTGLISELLLEEELVVLWDKTSTAPPEITLDALRDTEMVLPSGAHGLRIQIDEALRDIGLTPKVAVEIDSYSNIKNLVAAGFGASILPYHAVTDERQSGQLQISRLRPPGLWRGAHLLYPKDRPITRAQDAVRCLLRDVTTTLLQNGEWAGARHSTS